VARSRIRVSLTSSSGLEPMAPFWTTLEVELLDLLSQRQLGDGHLVLDRARVLVLGPMAANGSLSLISAVSKSPMIRWGSCCRFTAVAMISS
jgi:hypothetical protein